MIIYAGELHSLGEMETEVEGGWEGIKLKPKVLLTSSIKKIILYCFHGDSSLTLLLHNSNFVKFKPITYINMVKGKTSLLNDFVLLIL